MIYQVYVKTDENNRITSVDSSGFLSDLTGWTKIDEGGGDRYYLAQGNYFPNPIMDERGIYRYKLVDDVPVERTQEEMDADHEEPIPQLTAEERIKALEDQLAAYEAAYAEGVNEA